MGPGVALGTIIAGGRAAMESVQLTDWAIAAWSWRREAGSNRMQSSAQSLASDS